MSRAAGVPSGARLPAAGWSDNGASTSRSYPGISLTLSALKDCREGNDSGGDMRAEAKRRLPKATMPVCLAIIGV